MNLFREADNAKAREAKLIFTETRLRGAFIIDLDRKEDTRGYFARAFCQEEFRAHGLEPVIAQGNIAYNRRRIGDDPRS